MCCGRRNNYLISAATKMVEDRQIVKSHTTDKDVLDQPPSYESIDQKPNNNSNTFRQAQELRNTASASPSSEATANLLGPVYQGRCATKHQRKTEKRHLKREYRQEKRELRAECREVKKEVKNQVRRARVDAIGLLVKGVSEMLKK